MKEGSPTAGGPGTGWSACHEILVFHFFLFTRSQRRLDACKASIATNGRDS
ncbi:Uncharacterised protein [Bordetella pertussis]|nr:Uncharacterised protein [Bordetella pertussis]